MVLARHPRLARSPCARSSTSASKLRKHKIRVKDIIRDAEDDDQEFDEEEADRRIIRLIDKVKRLDKKKLRTCSKSARTPTTARARSGSTTRSEATRGAGRDARGDAPQQEDDRQDRPQAEGAHPEGRARRGRRHRAREAHRRRARTSCKRELREVKGNPQRRADVSPRSSASAAPSCSSSTPTSKSAQKGLKKVEEELQHRRRARSATTYERIRDGERIGRAAPRPSWSRRTSASSSRSPRSTRTAACSSSTSSRRGTSAS